MPQNYFFLARFTLSRMPPRGLNQRERHAFDKECRQGSRTNRKPQRCCPIGERRLMRGRHNIEGLANFGSHSRISSDSEIVEAVRKGDLLLVKERFASSGGGFIARSEPAPEPVYIPPKDPWPQTRPRDDQVFAKSCIPDNWCSTDAGTAPEPASDFGKVMVAGAMLFPSASTAIATRTRRRSGTRSHGRWRHPATAPQLGNTRCGRASQCFHTGHAPDQDGRRHAPYRHSVTRHAPCTYPCAFSVSS